MAFIETKPITYGTAGNDVVSGGGVIAATTGVKYATALDFNGNAGAVRIYGGAGNDSLYGTKYCDTLVGEAGNDYLRGGVGCDQLYGGAGDDTFFFKAGDLGTKYAPGTVLTAADWNPYTGGDMIMDFGGAGGYFAINNDFIAFSGFGTKAQGASLTSLGVCTWDAAATVYKVTGADGYSSLFTIKSLNGAGLTIVQDYNFY